VLRGGGYANQQEVIHQTTEISYGATMNVGLIGFGKSGKAVASVLLESKGIILQWIIRKSRVLEHRSASEFLGIQSGEPAILYSIEDINVAQLFDQFPVDVIVDFSSETGIDYYGKEAAARGITIITAVSKYSVEKLAFLNSLANQTKVMHSPNITIGINFLIIAAKILKNIAPYTDIEVIEEHYKKKPEVSGTAQVIAQNLDIPYDQIKTIRAGGIISVHEILFGFPYQTVRLKHESISREAFGNGILFAINNIPDKKTGVFTMEDLLIPFFHLNEPEKEFIKDKKKPWWKIW
jgi:4-hydroxy-tetrahydrodipicolinate reductase